jgi:hypothetical protein
MEPIVVVRSRDRDQSVHSVSENSKSATHDHDEISNEEVKLAKQETKNILRLRLTVVVILASSIIGVAIAVNSYTHKSENTRFEDQFENDAFKVLESVGSTLEKTMGAFDSLAVTFISFARAQNQSWPFVTIPDFPLHVSKILPLSKAMFIHMVPLVTSENRLQWEAFSLENKNWVDEAIKIQEKWKNYFGPKIDNWNAHGVITGDFFDMPYNLT